MAIEFPACAYCGISDKEAPLVKLLVNGKDYYICAQHLPILIHEPQKLAGKLPGVENLIGHNHDH